LKLIDFDIEELPESLKLIAETIGVYQTRKLMEVMAGSVVRFPSVLPPKMIKRYILQNYNGRNGSKIAAELGVSRATVCNYLNKKTA